MQNNQIKIIMHKRVQIALDALSYERNSVLKAINYIATFGLEQALGKNVEKVNTDELLYLLRATSSIRVIFRVAAQDEIEILEIVMRERLEIFAASNN